MFSCCVDRSKVCIKCLERSDVMTVEHRSMEEGLDAYQFLGYSLRGLVWGRDEVRT